MRVVRTLVIGGLITAAIGVETVGPGLGTLGHGIGGFSAAVVKDGVPAVKDGITDYDGSGGKGLFGEDTGSPNSVPAPLIPGAPGNPATGG